MSIDRCRRCDALVDTDAHPDSYVRGVCICEHCQDDAERWTCHFCGAPCAEGDDACDKCNEDSMRLELDETNHEGNSQ